MRRAQPDEAPARSTRRRWSPASAASASVSAALLDDPEPVAQPLHRGAGDEDRRLERVATRLADAPGDRRQQALPSGSGALAPAFCEQEAAGAVGVLAVAGLVAGLAEERGLLVAGDARDRHARRRTRASRRTRRARHAARAASARHAEQLAQLGVPARARGCRRAACATRSCRRSTWLAASACRAARSRSCRSAAPSGTLALVEQPVDLRARRSRGRGPGRCARGPAARGPPRAARRSASAVRRSCQTSARWSGRRSRGPKHHGLALVGDADRGDSRRRRRRGERLGGRPRA